MMILRSIQRRLRRPLRTLSSQQAYSLWAETYPAQAHNRLMEIEQEAMLSLLPGLDGCIVLDLACGSGRYAKIAQKQGAGQVIALDSHFSMVSAADVRLRGQAVMDAIPLPDTRVDVVICGMALGHIPQIGVAMREIHRVLNNGGVLLLSDFHPFQYLRGAQRTFTVPDGETYAVEHYPHLYTDYFQAAQDSGLTITAVLEPALPEGDHTPIVLVLRLEKQG